MSKPKYQPLDLDALRGSVGRADSTGPAASPIPNNDRRSWLTIALLCAVVFFAVMWFRDRGVGPTPGPNPPTPDIDVTGDYVLLLVDESRPESMTQQQWDAANSIRVAEWCESNGVKFRRHDVRDDLAKVEDVWRKLRDAADAEPGMLAAVINEKATVQEIPPGPDAAIAELERLK